MTLSLYIFSSWDHEKNHNLDKRECSLFFWLKARQKEIINFEIYAILKRCFNSKVESDEVQEGDIDFSLKSLQVK